MLELKLKQEAKPVKPPITVLAFDFGERRIGVAVGQSITGHARPIATLFVKSRSERLQAISPLVSEWAPDLLVVGQPFYPDGKSHEITALAAKFARQLSEHFRIPHALVDERYTSTEAQSRDVMQEQKNTSTSSIDARAAAIIAEQFFSNQQ